MTKGRKKKARVEDAGSDSVEKCAVPGCAQPPWPRSKFCAAHTLVDKSVAYAEKAMARGNVLQGLLGQLGVAAGPMVDNLMSRANAYVTGQMGNTGGQTSAGAGPRTAPPRSGPTPQQAFTFLGLDPKKATVEDVRRIQKLFAGIFHPDRGGAAIDPEMQSRVNTAADVALQWIRGRKSA